MIGTQPHSDDMLGLAEHLLTEIVRGMKPVWPTTCAYAQRLVLGLRTMRTTRPQDVATIVSHAPTGTPIDWPDLLSLV